jgi:hypothetical protein
MPPYVACLWLSGSSSAQAVSASASPHRRGRGVCRYCRRKGKRRAPDSSARRVWIWRRKPKTTVLVHSDQGSQFTSMDWAAFLKHHNLEHSMSRRGNCHDNAVAENFFNLLKRARIAARPTGRASRQGRTCSTTSRCSTSSNDSTIFSRRRLRNSGLFSWLLRRVLRLRSYRARSARLGPRQKRQPRSLAIRFAASGFGPPDLIDKVTVRARPKWQLNRHPG